MNASVDSVQWTGYWCWRDNMSEWVGV